MRDWVWLSALILSILWTIYLVGYLHGRQDALRKIEIQSRKTAS